MCDTPFLPRWAACLWSACLPHWMAWLGGTLFSGGPSTALLCRALLLFAVALLPFLLQTAWLPAGIALSAGCFLILAALFCLPPRMVG